MTNVNFKVNRIEKAMKTGCVVVYVQFEGSSKEYNFVRKAYNNQVIIDGCRVYFNDSFECTNIVREYETAGKKN